MPNSLIDKTIEGAGMMRSVGRYGSALLAALISASLLGGCGMGKSSQEYYQDAQRYHAKGDNKSAVIQLKNALQKNPDNGDARFLLGEIYSDAGNFAAAEDELQMARQYEKDKAKVETALGKVYLGRGEFQKIVDELKPEAGMDAQTRAGILTLKGNAYLGLGKPEEAKAAFAEALKIAPDFQEALLGEARLAASEKKLDEALSLVGQVLSRDPKAVKAWIMKGDLLRAQSNDEKAMEAYQEILKFDEANIPAHVSLASIDLSAGKYDDAQKEIDALDKVQPNNLMAKYLQALLYFRQSKLTDARDALLQVLKSAPEHMPSVLLMGAIDYSLNSLEEAQKNLGHFVGAFPSNVYARKLLASTQLKLNQPADAIKTLTPLLGGLHPDIQVKSLAAEAYMKQGDFTKAADYLESMAVMEPENANIRTVLGLNRVAGGQTDRAISDFEAAAKLNPSEMRPEMALALTYLGKKQYDQVLTVTRKMISKEPRNPVPYNLQGTALVGKQDIADARKSFGRALDADPKYIPAALNLALLDLRDKNLPSAQKRLQDILALDKNNLEAMMLMSAIARNSGNAGEEKDWLDKAVKANPAVLQPRTALVRYYLQQKDARAALDAAQAAVTAMPKNPEALDLLGGTQIVSGHTKDAVGTYQNLVKMVPRSPLAYFRLASAQMVIQDNAAAAASFARALELKPDYLEADNALISLDVKAKNYSAAEKVASDVQKRFPKSPLGLYMEGDIMMAQSQYGKAVEVLQKAQKLAPNSLGMMKLHHAMKMSGNARRADAMLSGWIASHPGDAAARRYMGEVLMQEGNAKGAIEQFQHVLKTNPGDAESLNDLALLYQQTKNPLAEQTANQAYKLVPNNPQIMDTYGWILVGNGKTKEGLGLLEKAAAMLKSEPDIHYHYAVALARVGEKAKAKQELQGALSSGSNFAELSDANQLMKQLQ